MHVLNILAEECAIEKFPDVECDFSQLPSQEDFDHNEVCFEFDSSC